MRTTVYTSDKTTYAQIAAIAQDGWLIVVPSSEDANRMRGLIKVFGRQCLWDLVHSDPAIYFVLARQSSVEVRTLAEIEQMDVNEKMAMEVW